MSKSRYSTNFQARFVRREKSFVKYFCNQRDRSFDFLSFEGKRIDFGANKPKLRRFEMRPFCDKMRPFGTISESTFWKIHLDIRVDEMRIRKEKVADSKIYGYVWAGPKVSTSNSCI